MKRSLSHISWPQVESLLNSWFNAGLSRHSSLPFTAEHYSRDAALFAASIFKRGGLELLETTQGQVIPVLNGQDSEQKFLETQVFHSPELQSNIYSRWHNSSTTTFICDAEVLALHPKIANLLSSANLTLLKLSCDEEKKTLDSIKTLWQNLPSITEEIVVIGGGICCDMGGFLAGLAGTRVHYIPTTLLSLVDAGLGGKTGVNHPLAGKNQIGLFVQVESLTIIPELLTSLNDSQIRQGVAEILKHTFLSGTFDLWKPLLERLVLSWNPSILQSKEFLSLIQENLEFKSRIVRADPLEKDLRAFLNFGHTVAHLLESLDAIQRQEEPFSGSGISHGIAVAVGLLSFCRGGLAKSAPPGFAQLLEEILRQERIFFPMHKLRDIQGNAQMLLQHDKKNISHQNDFVRCITPEYGCLMRSPSTDEKPNLLNSQTKHIKMDEFLTILQSTGLFE